MCDKGHWQAYVLLAEVDYLSGGVKKLTKHQLWEYEEWAKARAAQGQDLMFMTALPVLDHFLGSEWCRLHLCKKGPLKPPPFKANRDEYVEAGLLGCTLAEMLFNLQNIEGFDHVRKRLADGNVDGCIAELEVGRFFKVYDEPFRFVRDQQGRRYDIELTDQIPSVCCEVKRKLRGDEELTHRSISESLKKAKEQLPKGSPGLIFIRVIGSRSQERLIATVQKLEAVLPEFFRRTQRVTAVFALANYVQDIEVDEEHPNGLTRYEGHLPLSKRFVNRNANFPASFTDRFTRRLVFPETWTYFSFFFGTVQPPSAEWIERERRRVENSDFNR